MMSDPSSYHRGCLPDNSCSLFQFERYVVISVIKNSIIMTFAGRKGAFNSWEKKEKRKLKCF